MSRTSCKTVAAAIAAGVVLMSGTAFAGTITGTVTYTGKVPNLKPIAMDADPNCAKKHTTPQPSDVLVLGDGNTMANIMVRVTKGLPEGKKYPVPTTPVVMDQNGCHYDPHVIGIMEGQELLIKNSDGILHNVHALPKVNKPFNRAMPATVKESNATFEKPEDIFPVKCDVHPWMSAYIAVLTNPFFAVTKKDGKFSIAGLDPGTYTIEAWHEKLGTQTATVTVGASDTKTADFKFAAPAAK